MKATARVLGVGVGQEGGVGLLPVVGLGGVAEEGGPEEPEALGAHLLLAALQ